MSDKKEYEKPIITEVSDLKTAKEVHDLFDKYEEIQHQIVNTKVMCNNMDPNDKIYINAKDKRGFSLSTVMINKEIAEVILMAAEIILQFEGRSIADNIAKKLTNTDESNIKEEPCE